MFEDANVVKQGRDYVVSYGDDSRCYVEFSVEAIEDQEATIAEGRPIFKDIDFITIRFAGDKNTVIKRPVKAKRDNEFTPSDIERWPKHYEAFKNSQSVVTTGTPITEWAMITKSMAMELKALNIHTVEMLAAVSDANLSWHGARTLRDKAKSWIDQAKDGSGISVLQAENEKLRVDLEAMRAEIRALAGEKKPLGRPRKEVTDAESLT